MTDCLLLWEGPNGLFNCAHIVRSDKISYLPLQMTWNSCLKITKHFRMAQFVMHFQLSMLLSVLSEVACAQCILCHRKGKKLFFMYFSDFWWVNRFRIADSFGKRMKLHTHRHTLALCCSTVWGVPDLFMVMVKLVWNVPTSLHRPAKLEIYLFFPSSFTYSSVYTCRV